MASKRIRGITIDIDGNVMKLSKALEDVDKRSTKTSAALKDVNRLLKMDPKNTELIAQKQKLLTDAIKETKEALEIEKRALADMDASGVEKTSDEYMALQREIAATEQRLRDFEAEGLNIGKTAGSNLQDLGDKFKQFGEKVEKVGQDLTTKVTLPIVGLGTAAGKAASDFEEAFAKLSTIADSSEVATDELRKQVMDLSNASGIAAGDVAEATYNAISAGQNTSNAVKFVESANKLAKAGFTSLGTSVDTLTTITNAYGKTAGTVEEISNKLITTQNDGKITVDELGASLGKVIPTAAMFNVNLDQLASAYVTTTKNGIAAAESTTYINSMLNELGKSGTKASKALEEETGQSFASLMSSGKSLGDVMQILQDKANKTGKSMADMFGSAEAGKAAATIAQHSSDFDSALADMRASAGATEEAFRTMDETAGASFEKMKTSAVNSLVTIGEELLPMIVPVLQSIASFLQQFGEWLNTLDDDQKKMIITILAVVAAIGPLLIVIGKISTGVGALMTILPMLSGPVGIVIAVIAALVAVGVLLYKNWDTIKDTAKSVWSSVKQTFGDGVQKVKDKVRQLGELPRKALDWGRDFIDGFARGIKEKIGKVVDAVKGVGAKIKRFLHFSRPDEGPLHEYEEWPRDFVEGYAQGIRSNLYRITDASREMAAAMAYPTGSGAAARSAAESSGIMSAVGQDINRGVAALQGLTVVMDTGQTVGALAPKMTAKVVDNITKDWRWK